MNTLSLQSVSSTTSLRPTIGSLVCQFDMIVSPPSQGALLSLPDACVNERK